MKSYITDITRCFCTHLYYQDNKGDDDFLYHLREQKDTSEHTDFDSFSDIVIEWSFPRDFLQYCLLAKLQTIAQMEIQSI